MEKQKIENWKVLRSEYIAKEPWFTARRDEVQLPNGNVIPFYYVLEYPAWICVIALTKEGGMIMERQYRHGIGRVDYELCAGVVDPTDASPRRNRFRKRRMAELHDHQCESRNA